MENQQKAEYRSISWQLELLIAGGILISLYSSTDIFREFFFHKYPIIDFSHYQALLFFGLYILTRTLLIGFGATLIFRTVWLAYKGIDYWYPEGVNYDEFKISDTKKDSFEVRSSASKRLQNLEKWSNLSFSMAIILTFIVLSTVVVCLIVNFILLDILDWQGIAYDTIFNYSLATVVFLTQLGVFHSLNLRTRNTILDKIGAILRKFYYYISLSFLYERELLVIRTNGRKWLLILFGTLYLVTSLVVSVNQIGKFYQFGTFNFELFDDRETYDLNYVYTVDTRVYEEFLDKGDVFYRGGIQSEVISGKFLKLFMVHWNSNDSYLNKAMDSLGMVKDRPEFETDSLFQDFAAKRLKKYRTALNMLHEVRINRIKVDSIIWERYKHPKTNEEGYVTFLNVDSLPVGRHILQVDKRFYWDSTVNKLSNISLPFWKE